MTKVSVIMPVYNGEKYLDEAIESILSQSYKDFEFIILDDGSTDSSPEIISRYYDSRIKLISLKHVGLVSALNEGIKKSTGEYILRCDSDDVSMPDRISTQVSILDNNPSIGMCGSWAEIIDGIGNKVGEMTYPPIDNRKIKKYALLHSPFIHPSVIMRKNILLQVGGYKNFRHVEDYELWTRILNRTETCNLPRFLIKYRIHDGQITKRKKWLIKFIGIFVRILAILRY